MRKHKPARDRVGAIATWADFSAGHAAPHPDWMLRVLVRLLGARTSATSLAPVFREAACAILRERTVLAAPTQEQVARLSRGLSGFLVSISATRATWVATRPSGLYRGRRVQRGHWWRVQPEHRRQRRRWYGCRLRWVHEQYAANR